MKFYVQMTVHALTTRDCVVSILFNRRRRSEMLTMLFLRIYRSLLMRKVGRILVEQETTPVKSFGHNGMTFSML